MSFTKQFFLKTIFFASILLFSKNAYSTHIAGGDLDIQWISGNDYRVTLKLFRDCANGGAGFDNSVTITVRDNATHNIVTSFTMDFKESTNLTLGDACFSPPSSVCMQEGVYTRVVTLANNPNGLYMAWERCCRSPLNLNLVDDQAMVFYAQMPDPALRNSSPKFGNYPVNGYMCVNEKNYFNFDVSDLDGDELRFSLITPLRGSATGTGSPVSATAGSKPYREILWQSPYNLSNIVGGTPNMSINPVTGIVTCSPVSQGAFTFAILVEEYRGGVKIGEVIRDIQFFALNCNKQVASINQTPIDDDTALEGCIKASFKFELSKALSKDTTICYEIQGSAINGVDYAFLDDCITISAGQTYGTIIIDAYNEGILEGKEDIYLIYNPIPCVDFVKDTVFLFIDDAQPIDFELDGVNLTCNGDFSGQIDADITGGYPPYVITITTDSGNGTSTNYTDADLPITGLPAGTYLVEIDDIYGCGGTAQPVAAVWDAGATFLPDGDGNVYTTTLTVSGISNPTMTDPDEIQQVCLNMEHSFLGDLEMKLIAPDGTELILKERFNAADGNSCDLGEPIAKAPKDGGGSSNTDPGTGWDYCFTPTPNYGTMVDESDNYTRNYTDPLGRTYNDNYLPSGAYTSYEPFSDLIGVPLNGDWTIWVKDHLPQDNGWIFNWSIVFKSGGKLGDIITLTEPDPIDITLNGSVTQPSCGGSNGAINIDVNGDFPPFDYSWSNGATTQDISGLSAGTYTVTVTDNNSCTNEASFDVSNATGPGISAVVQDERCVAQNNGSIDATFTTSGTITSIIWSNGPTTEDISNLSPGDYTVEVTDNSNCKSLQTFTINAATDILTSGSITNEKCGDQEGEIDITVSGGAGSYTFVWSNGATSEDITDLNQNTYTVTVTDANNCSKQKSFNVINEVGQCTVNCDVAIISTTIVDEICGDDSGSISISVSTSNAPYYVNWSNGMTGDVISGLSAGSYTATVTDAESCEFIQTFTVGNDAGTLAITNPSITDETCGSGNGSIDVSVSGGNGSYTYSWSNSASSQDVSSLSAGDYTLTVTDGTGCSISATFTVLNDAGSMAINLVSQTDEVCGNGNGSINISVSPNATYSYLWSNGTTTQDVTNLSAGTYSVVVTNTSTGCQLTSQDFVIANASGSLSVVINDTDNEVCGSSNGEIDLTISGGTPTYNILWNTGATTQDLVDIPAGTYSATITDQNGCTSQTGDIVILNLSGNLSATTIVTNEVCGDGQGAINLIVSGGTPSYDYTWNTGATTEDISNLSSGVYTYTVEDQNGCIFSNSASVGNDAGTLSIDNINVTNTLCGTSNGAIDITVSGGDGSYTYVWSNGASSEDLTNITNGTYTVTVLDGSGCSIDADITVNGALTLDNVTITNDICGTSVGAIDITISGGSTYTYQWSNGATTQDISGLIVGAYTVVVTSFEGCTYTNTFNVGSNPICNELCLNSYSNAASGSIYDSGGASGNYKNDENCGFLIEPYCATSIRLSFQDFRMENNADYLMVYDGVDNTGTLLVRATGTSLPSAVTANSGAMFVQYSSDISRNDRGFRANWTSVQDFSIPTADFIASNNNPAFGEEVDFTDLSTGGIIKSWSWDVDGDGVEDYNSQNISHSYFVSGTYTITLTIEACDGSFISYSLDITVQGEPQISVAPSTVIDITIDDCSEHTEQILILNNGSGDLFWNIEQSSYDVTDNFDSGKSNSALWSNISLGEVTNSGCGSNSGSYALFFNGAGSRYAQTKPMDATQGTFISFYLNINGCSDNAEAGEEVVLEYSINNGASWVNIKTFNIWAFVGFTFANESIPSGAKTTSTIFRIRQLNNSGNWSDNWSMDDVTIRNVKLNTASNVILSPTSGITMPSQSTSVTITVYPYNTAGNYSKNFTIYSNDPINPEINLTINILQTVNCIQTMCLDATSSSPVGKLTDSGGSSANYSNNENCTFLISPNCADEITLTFDAYYCPTNYDYMTIYDGTDDTAPLIASFVYITSPPSPVKANSGSMFIVWKSNDNATYPGFEANWTATQDISIPVAGFTPSSTTTYTGQTVTFTNTSTDEDTWSWDMDNDGIEDYDTENPTHVYSSPGVYSVTLTVTNCNGSDTYTVVITVLDFFCEIGTTTQSSGQLTDSGGESDNYSNDENCSLLIQPNCVGQIDLTFTEIDIEENDTLYVYDGVDASGTLLLKFTGTTAFIPFGVTTFSKSMFLQFISDGAGTSTGFIANWTSTISPDAPVADFTTTPTGPFVDEAITFNNTTTGTSHTWNWDFGDETTSTDQNPQHIFITEDCYDVTLYVTNNEGCESTITKEVCVKTQTETNPGSEEPQPLPFRIYPNPTTGIVGIDLTSKEFELIVYNVLGERVNYGLNKLNDYQYVVDISQLSRATYIFKLNGQAYKIVKMD